jgi:hypothetical protein
VESSTRFGVVALLYHAAGDASSKSAVAAAQTATGASSSGTVTAGSAGYSTATIAGIGLGAAAVAGGTAAAVSGSGGGGDKKESDPLTEASILGDWNVTGRQNGFSLEGTYTFMEDGIFLFDTTSTSATGEQSNQAADGTWALNAPRMTIFYRVGGGLGYSGTADGDADAFVFASDDGESILNFKR